METGWVRGASKHLNALWKAFAFRTFTWQLCQKIQHDHFKKKKKPQQLLKLRNTKNCPALVLALVVQSLQLPTHNI